MVANLKEGPNGPDNTWAWDKITQGIMPEEWNHFLQAVSDENPNKTSEVEQVQGQDMETQGKDNINMAKQNLETILQIEIAEKVDEIMNMTPSVAFFNSHNWMSESIKAAMEKKIHDACDNFLAFFSANADCEARAPG